MPISEQASEEATPLVKLLIAYLNCAYYTLQCPFRLEYDRSCGQVSTKYNKYLRTVYIVVATAAQLIVFYDSIILTSSTFSWAPDTSQGDMRIVLDSIMNWFWILLSLSIKWELWHAPGRIEQILMLLIKLEKKLQPKKLRYFGLLKYPAFCAAIIHTHMTAFSFWEVSMALLNRNDTAVLSVGASTYQLGHQTAVVASALYENQVTQITSKLVPLIAFTFASIAYALNANSKDYEANETMEVLGLVNEISMRNKMCFGFSIAATCFCQLPYSARYLHDLFTASWSQKCHYIYYLSLLLLQLWLGSEAHLKLSSMNCFSGDSKGIDCCQDVSPSANEAYWPLSRRALLVDACNNRNSLGVRGHFITFTYPFLGHINLWILAYAVTVIQFQSLQAPCQ